MKCSLSPGRPTGLPCPASGAESGMPIRVRKMRRRLVRNALAEGEHAQVGESLLREEKARTGDQETCSPGARPRRDLAADRGQGHRADVLVVGGQRVHPPSALPFSSARESRQAASMTHVEKQLEHSIMFVLNGRTSFSPSIVPQLGQR